jgi:hypothetical protein
MQQQAIQAASAGKSSSSSPATGRISWLTLLHTPGQVLRQLLRLLLAIPARLLEPPVRLCQQYTQSVGISGMSCAGLGVWNVDSRWWWLLVRELVKFVLVLAAAATTMRGPGMQAMLLLLLVVLAAVLSWQVQAGCGTTMTRLLFVSYLWLQFFALLVLLLTTQGVDGVVFGGVLLGLLVVLVLQVLLMLFGLAYQCLSAGKQMSLFQQSLASAGLA